MKLKEKFLDHVYCFMGSGMLTNTYDEDIANWNADKCEKIADDFSVEFANWLEQLTPSQKVSVWSKDGSSSGLFTMDNEQLLEKFKRTKGL